MKLTLQVLHSALLFSMFFDVNTMQLYLFSFYVHKKSLKYL